MSPHHVFRVPDVYSRQKLKKISALIPELVFRDAPGNSVQRDLHRVPRLVAGVAHLLPRIESPRGRVFAIA